MKKNKEKLAMRYFIKADHFLLENGSHEGEYLLVEDGRFGGFFTEPPFDAIIKDYTGSVIAPGLFDAHIHGLAGFDVMDGTVEAIMEISQSLLSLGVTRFLPTTLTSSKTELEKSICAIKDAVAVGLPGAQSSGIFLEGPYFTEEHKGAQNPAHFRDPSVEEFNHWQQIANGQIVKIALAPERKSAMPFIEEVSKNGISVGIAHTSASYDCCQTAVEHGANVFIHLFNGMTGLHHREPGVVGAALTNPDVFAELICDGYHVHPDVAKLALSVKRDKLVLITDCMRAGKMTDGKYYLGNFLATISNGIARTETGSLAGSTLQLLDGIKNLQKWSGESLTDIWHLASLAPAKSVNQANKLGSIAPEKIADYVVLDKNLNVQATAIAGEIKYRV